MFSDTARGEIDDNATNLVEVARFNGVSSVSVFDLFHDLILTDISSTDLSQSSEEEKMKLGYLTQQLVHYLGAADPTSSSQGDILNPAEIDQYGFKSMTDLLNLCSSVCSPPPGGPISLDDTDLLSLNCFIELISQFKINGFTLSSPNLTPLGVSVSPVVALCNHSCEPNAIVVFPEGGGKGIHLIAIRDIQPGEEVCPSYLRSTSVPVYCRPLRLMQQRPLYRF